MPLVCSGGDGDGDSDGDSDGDGDGEDGVVCGFVPPDCLSKEEDEGECDCQPWWTARVRIRQWIGPVVAVAWARPATAARTAATTTPIVALRLTRALGHRERHADGLGPTGGRRDLHHW